MFSVLHKLFHSNGGILSQQEELFRRTFQERVDYLKHLAMID